MTRPASLILIAALLLTIGCSTKEPVAARRRSPSTRSLVNVSVATVQRTDLSATVELIGSLMPRRRTMIVTEVDGIVTDIPRPHQNPITLEFEGRQKTLPLDIGSEVSSGDLLVKLDATDYELDLRVAEAASKKLAADLTELLAWQRPEEVARTRALYEEAQANLQRAQSDFERVQSLHQSKAVSDSEFEEKQAHLRQARAVLAHAQANLDIAEAGPTKEQIAVAKAALAAAEAEVDARRLKVEKTRIAAPYDAVITERFVEVGDRVTALPRVEIMELMDLSFLSAEVGVPAKYSGKVRNLDRASVQVQGVSDAVPGLVVRINDKVDPASRTFRVRVAIENDERLFRVGQQARVYLDVDSSCETLTIPHAAVSYSGGQPHVFVYENDRVVRQAISLGIANTEAVEVLTGLREGQSVVVDDPAVLTDGMRVQLHSDLVASATRGRSAP